MMRLRPPVPRNWYKNYLHPCNLMTLIKKSTDDELCIEEIYDIGAFISIHSEIYKISIKKWMITNNTAEDLESAT